VRAAGDRYQRSRRGARRHAARQSLGETLYKTKVLFHQLGRKDLVPWVTHEITGYPDECEVPPYRLIGAQVRCNLMNTGWTNSNQLLPTPVGEKEVTGWYRAERR